MATEEQSPVSEIEMALRMQQLEQPHVHVDEISADQGQVLQAQPEPDSYMFDWHKETWTSQSGDIGTMANRLLRQFAYVWITLGATASCFWNTPVVLKANQALYIFAEGFVHTYLPLLVDADDTIKLTGQKRCPARIVMDQKLQAHAACQYPHRVILAGPNSHFHFRGATLCETLNDTRPWQHEFATNFPGLISIQEANCTVRIMDAVCELTQPSLVNVSICGHNAMVFLGHVSVKSPHGRVVSHCRGSGWAASSVTVYEQDVRYNPARVDDTDPLIWNPKTSQRFTR
eukprot:TRINITY_DN10368_c0_g2_i2.p1 TRINITY_DN10368_c0_g2~~TRINITY_DN10368_c0_g2_i2.p1  ORF type:complete len:330 (-),score=41.20 TRINITY_DN10368_c0_g2_i2:121-984(-)